MHLRLRSIVLPLLVCGAASIAVGGDASLYERLGGQTRVTEIVDETIDIAVASPTLGRSFKDTKIPHIKEMLVEQICALSGGGCKYTGDSMKDVHAGHKIDQREFYGLVEVLRESMKNHGVGIRERNELLAVLAPMKRDVVEQ